MSKKSYKRQKNIPASAELNKAFQDETFVEKLKVNFRSGSFEDGNGLILYNEPFTCCCIPNFLENDTFLVELKDELLNLEFFPKSNDLYQFHQSDDLKNCNSPFIVALRTFLYGDFKKWMESVTGLSLATTVDMSCARYDHTDVLLCHDDMLEGRRIAYILYLVPSWKKEDGGTLDLFNTDKDGDPLTVVKSFLPQWNSLVFFEVDHKSYHQVAEVFTEDKTRLSISGWFYGDPLEYPSKNEELLKVLHPLDFPQEEVMTFVKDIYWEDSTLSAIKERFLKDSEIELLDFLDEKKYNDLCLEFENSDVDWTLQGPPNKRMYEAARPTNPASAIDSCYHFMQSDLMFLLLSKLTGLKLHKWAFDEFIDSDEEESDDDDDDFSSSSKSSDGELEIDSNHSKAGVEKGLEAKSKNTSKTDNESASETDCGSSNSRDEEELEAGCEMTSTLNGAEELGTKLEKRKTKKGINPVCAPEIRRWKHGSYTLLHDNDREPLTYALDVTLFLNCEDWSKECGGYTTYITKGKNEELLTVYPRANSLAVVFRDKKTLRFVKHINSNSKKLNKPIFHTISCVYYE